MEETIFQFFSDFLKRKESVELEHHRSFRLEFTISIILLVKHMNYTKLWFCQCHMFLNNKRKKLSQRTLLVETTQQFSNSLQVSTTGNTAHSLEKHAFHAWSTVFMDMKKWWLMPNKNVNVEITYSLGNHWSSTW